MARARGELVTLDSSCARVTVRALLAVVTANGALRELRKCSAVGLRHSALHTDALEALLRAAPRLAVCEVDVACRKVALALCLLRNEPPFALLHVHSFTFDGSSFAEAGEANVVALAADIASHTHLRRLRLVHASLHTAAALDAGAQR